MKLSEKLQVLIVQNQGSSSALLTFREYCVSLKNRILQWMSDEIGNVNQKLSIVVPWTHEVSGIEVTEEVLGFVSRQQFEDASNDLLNEFDVVIDGVGTTVQLTADELIEAVEQSVSSSNIQAEFVDYCINSEEVSVDGFRTRITTLLQDYKPEILDSFCNLISGSSPIDALRGLLSTQSITGLLKKQSGSEYIQIVSPLGYTGVNVMLYALDKVTAIVDSFFINVVWQGILHIGEFLQSAWTALKNLFLYVVKLIAAPLLSRYDAQKANFGILDLPILQLKIDKFSFQNLNISGVKTAKTAKTLDPWSATNQVFLDAWLRYGNISADYENGYFTSYGYRRGYNSFLLDSASTLSLGGLFDVIEVIANACTEIVDGNIYKKPISFPLPTATKSNTLVSMNVTFGFDSNDYLIMQIFPVFPKNILKNYNDKEIYNLIRKGFFDTLMGLCEVAPMSLYPDAENTATWCSTYVDMLLTPPSNDDPDNNFDVVAHCLTYTSIPTWPYDSLRFFGQMLFRGIIPYVGMSNLIFDATKATASKYGAIDTYQLPLWRYVTCAFASSYHSGSYSTLPIVVSSDFNDATNADYYGFLPYIANSSLPISVHYQTIEEAANEVITYSLTLIIIAIVAWASIKYYKYTKRRRAIAAIKRGAADSASWEMGSRPTSSQIKEYMRLDKAARRAERLNRFMGVSTSGDTSSFIIDSVSKVKDVALQAAGVDKRILDDGGNTTVVTTNDIMKKITG